VGSSGYEAIKVNLTSLCGPLDSSCVLALISVRPRSRLPSAARLAWNPAYLVVKPSGKHVLIAFSPLHRI